MANSRTVIILSVASMVAVIALIKTDLWMGTSEQILNMVPYDQKDIFSKQIYYSDKQNNSSNSSNGDVGSVRKPSSTLDDGNVTNKQSMDNTPPDDIADCIVKILIYKKDKSTIGRKPGIYPCEDLGCSFKLSYFDRPSALKDKDIVLLYLRTHWEWDELLRARPAGQIWIFYSRESPLHDHGIVPPRNIIDQTYNWTMTYRLSSTIRAVYGAYISGEPDVPENDTRNWAAGKTKMAAWMASNCNIAGWKRSSFIRKFSQKYLPIDMYGKCGTLECPKDDRCPETLSKYKFYFALENSLCKEYITEKFWRNALSYSSVPIVYGAPKEDYLRIAPPHSFIHLADFKSPDELTKYLQTLDNNDTLYNEYFEWRKKGRVVDNHMGRLFLPQTFCQMVKKFLELKRKNNHIIQSEKPPNLIHWWKNSCGVEGGLSPVIKKVLYGRAPSRRKN